MAESGSSSDIDPSTGTNNDSGVQTNLVTAKNPKLAQKSTRDVVIEDLFEQIASLGLLSMKLALSKI